MSRSLFFSLFTASLILVAVSSPVPAPRYAEHDQQTSQQQFGFPPSSATAEAFSTRPSEFTLWHEQTRQRPATALGGGSGGGGGGKLETNGNGNGTNAGAAVAAAGTPGNCTLVPSYLCFSETVQSFRDREMRLNAIKLYVLNTLGQGRLPAAPPSQVSSSSQVGRSAPPSPFTGKLQTYLASCDVPSNVDSDTWIRSGLFHLYFNITGSGQQQQPTGRSQPITTRQPFNPFQNIPSGAPPASANTAETVISAKLKLFKRGTDSSRQGLPLAAPTRAEPCNDTNAVVSDRAVPTVQIPVLRNSFELNTNAAVDERIRVSVYWYTTPVSKHHYKKKLLDTRMLSTKEDEWVEFDIQRAAKEWAERGTNYGLTLEVENEDDDLMDPSKFFANVPCTRPNSTGLPEGIRSIVNLSNDQVPLLEVCTLALPASASASVSSSGSTGYIDISAANPFPSSVMGRAFKAPRSSGSFPQPTPWRGSGDEHRRRHHHHYSQNQASQGQARTQENMVDGNFARGDLSGENAMQQDDASASTSNVETTTKFELDAHHPLRHIFATASTKFGRNRNRRRYFRTRVPVTEFGGDGANMAVNEDDNNNLTTDVNEDEDGNGSGRRVVIENIFVESPSSSSSSSQSRGSRLPSRTR